MKTDGTFQAEKGGFLGGLGEVSRGNQYHHMIEGRLEVKLPTIWTDGKAEVGRVREEKRGREKIREEKESEERRCRCAKS